MSFLCVKNLSVTLNNALILKKINFVLEKGEILSILGPNGSGKSTLIKALLELIPHQGDVFLNNLPLGKNLSQVGYVPQKFDFDKTFPITVKEFLDLLPHTYDIQLQEKICQDIKINTLLNKKLGELSGGQLQRVLIGQALLKKVELLVLDEPTAGVDIEGAKNFYELLSHLNRKHHLTIILISHEINIVYKFSDKVIFLNQQSFCFGKPHEVLTEKFLTKTYGNRLEFREHLSH